VDAIEKMMHGISELDLESQTSDEVETFQRTKSLLKREETPFESLQHIVSKHEKESGIIMSLENYYPNKLGIQELFHEADEDSESTSAIPFKVFSMILRMNMEGRDCLEQFEEMKQSNI
jgi:hypothetical protein